MQVIVLTPSILYETGSEASETTSPSSEQTVSSSKIEQIRIDSQALGKEMHATVYLPPDYSPDFRYPVLYLFHGYGGSHGDYFTYLHLDAVADRLLQKDLVHPLIMVAPEYGNSFGVNSKPGEGQDPGGVSIGYAWERFKSKSPECRWLRKALDPVLDFSNQVNSPPKRSSAGGEQPRCLAIDTI